MINVPFWCSQELNCTASLGVEAGKLYERVRLGKLQSSSEAQLEAPLVPKASVLSEAAVENGI